MILAILDDLLFTSKIRAAAKQAGAALTFARSAEAAIEAMRTTPPPALVIFDLNNPRTDPIGVLTRMQGEAGLSAIRTIGFVAHTDTPTIMAARQAGVGEVVARSAFFEQLPALLRPAG